MPANSNVLREKDLVIETMNEAHNLLMKEKDAEIERLKAEFQKAREWNQLIEIQVKNLQSIVEDQNAEIKAWKENERRALSLMQTRLGGDPMSEKKYLGDSVYIDVDMEPYL